MSNSMSKSKSMSVSKSASKSVSKSKSKSTALKHNTYNSLFDGMHQYMFSAENILRNSSVGNDGNNVTANTKTYSYEKKKEKTEESATYLPRQHDTLFWCFFIVMHGFEEYELYKCSPFKKEKDFKIASVELIRKHAAKLKAMKLKLTVIENELVNEPRITLVGLRALALVYGVSIFYVSGCSYCDFDYLEGGEDSPRGILVYDKATSKTSVKFKDNAGSDADYTNGVQKTHFCIANPEKPMNAISGYTLSDLQEICKKLRIPTLRTDGKKETKKTLYESILNAI